MTVRNRWHLIGVFVSVPVLACFLLVHGVGVSGFVGEFTLLLADTRYAVPQGTILAAVAGILLLRRASAK